MGTLLEKKAFYLPMPSVDAATIEARVTSIFATHQMTQDDRAFLLSVLRNGQINNASETLINKIYEALATGKVRIVS